MAGLRLPHYLAIAATLVLVVLLFFAPRHDGGVVSSPASQEDDEPPTVENTIDSALAIINGDAPMQGILLLREVAAANPDNFRAQYHLGKFSAQTGQWEKVIDRFINVQRIEPSFSEANYWLGMAKMNMGNNLEAKAHLEAFLEVNGNNSELSSDAQTMLNQLK